MWKETTCKTKTLSHKSKAKKTLAVAGGELHLSNACIINVQFTNIPSIEQADEYSIKTFGHEASSYLTQVQETLSLANI